MSSLLLACCLTAAFAAQDDARQKAPEPAAQKDCEKLIRELFKAEYAKSSPSDRIALARKLLQQGKDNKDDPGSRFVLFREARDLAAQAGDTTLALEAVDALAKYYEVDVPALTAAALAAAAKASKTPEDARSLAAAYLKLADDAATLEDYDTAEKAVASAVSQARKSKDVPFATRAEARARELADEKSRFAAVRKAKETLAANPEDPAANLAVGRYHCLVKGRWDTGLPFLSKSPDSPLKDLAVKDLENPADDKNQLQLGDAWWDLSEKESGKVRDNLRARAASWYEKGIPAAAGLARAKIERRLEEIRRTSTVKRIDLLKLIDPAQDITVGEWSLKGGALVKATPGTCMIPYVPPDEYDLRLVVERTEGAYNLAVGFVIAGRQCGISIDGTETSDRSGLSLLDGKSTADGNDSTVQGKVLLLGKQATVLCSIRKTGVALSVDGKQVFDWKGDPGRLSNNPGNKLNRADAMFLGGAGLFKISEIVLFPVSGEGKRVR